MQGTENVTDIFNNDALHGDEHLVDSTDFGDDSEEFAIRVLDEACANCDSDAAENILDIIKNDREAVRQLMLMVNTNRKLILSDIVVRELKREFNRAN